jgi:hypothetical protein
MRASLVRAWSTCEKCARVFASRNQSHSCAQRGVDEHFPSELARGLFDTFLAAVRENGAIRVISSKTRIGLQIRMTFAAVMPNLDAVLGHRVLARRALDPLFTKIETISRRNRVHHFPLTAATELTPQFRA